MKCRVRSLAWLTSIALLLLCGCNAGNGPAPDLSANQTEPGGPPMELTSFSFSHTASSMDSCYRFEVAKTETGTHLYAEELFFGGRIADTMIEEPVLEQLGELAGACRIDRWDGFDKSNRNVMDGKRFSLNVTLADGSTITAHGNNAFPENYSDLASAVLSLYTELMEKYGEEP